MDKSGKKLRLRRIITNRKYYEIDANNTRRHVTDIMYHHWGPNPVETEYGAGGKITFYPVVHTHGA